MMLRNFIVTFSLTALSSSGMTLAWTITTTTPTRRPSTQSVAPSRTLSYRAKSLQQFQASAGKLSFIFQGPEDEEECADEEECEINWDFMPGGGEETEQSSPPAEKTAPVDDTLSSYSDPPSAVQPTRPKTMGDILEGSRVRMEVNWQIDECKTDVDSCEDFCEDCTGTGQTTCRFCRGTNMLALNGDIKPCPICDQGKETCESCRGTGFIAPWAMTMGDHLEGKRP